MGGPLPLVPVLSDGQRERPETTLPCAVGRFPHHRSIPLERPEGEPDVVAAHVGGEGEDALTLDHAAILARNSSAVYVHLRQLHGPHASAIFSIPSVPPRDSGVL